MFRNTISETPFVTRWADEVFPNIRMNGSLAGDVTPLSTARCVIGPKIKESGESLDINVPTVNSPNKALFAEAAGEVMDYLMAGVTTSHGNFSIVNYRRADKETSAKLFEFLHEHFTEMHEGFAEVPAIRQLYINHKTGEPVVDCMYFCNVETHTGILFCTNVDVQRLHYLMAAFFQYFPWFFEWNEERAKMGESGVDYSRLDIQLISSFCKKTSDLFNEVTQKYSEQYDFESARTRSLLAGFETKADRLSLQRAKRDAERLMNEYRNYRDALANSWKSIQDNNAVILGLQARIDSEQHEDSEILSLFLANKNLVLEEVEDAAMTFVVKDYLDYFDEEKAADIIANKRSFVYRPNGNDYSSVIKPDDMGKLCRKIFVDREFRIKMCAAYRIDLSAGRVDALRNYSYDPMRFVDYIPNPHIDRFNCLGGYERALEEIMLRRDYLMAVTQCIASCKSINIEEAPTMETFFGWFYNNARNTHCIELPDGTVVDPAGAIRYIREQESHVEEEKEEKEA